jgi:hypothetical protein
MVSVLICLVFDGGIWTFVGRRTEDWFFLFTGLDGFKRDIGSIFIKEIKTGGTVEFAQSKTRA